jgi:hypothetical protein
LPQQQHSIKPTLWIFHLQGPLRINKTYLLSQLKIINPRNFKIRTRQINCKNTSTKYRKSKNRIQCITNNDRLITNSPDSLKRKWYNIKFQSNPLQRLLIIINTITRSYKWIKTNIILAEWEISVGHAPNRRNNLCICLSAHIKTESTIYIYNNKIFNKNGYNVVGYVLQFKQYINYEYQKFFNDAIELFERRFILALLLNLTNKYFSDLNLCL